MSYNFEKMCPAVAKHIQANGGAFDLDWLEQHIAGCNHCKSIMRLVNATVINDIRSEVGGEDETDKLKDN